MALFERVATSYITEWSIFKSYVSGILEGAGLSAGKFLVYV
jgi:hypothetical protein